MTELEIASYLDRGLRPADRDRVEDHLADCIECRQSVSEAERLVGGARRSRRLFLTGGLVAAAAAAVIVMRPQITSKNATVRGDDRARAATSLVAYGPIGERAERPIRFVWSAASDAVSYRLSVSRIDAVPVWSYSGTDTVAILPDSIALPKGNKYMWVADAILADGSTRSTGLKEFGPVR